MGQIRARQRYGRWRLRYEQAIQAMPTAGVVAVSVLLLSGIALWAEDVAIRSPWDLVSRQAIGAVFESAESIAIATAVILYIKEAPDRKAQKHYEAWQVIDHAAAAKLPISYARRKALEDLYADGIAMTGLDINGADLNGIELPFVDLTHADLHRANFQGANLQGATLQDANLLHINLKSSNLRGANLSFARLPEADLQWANLRESSLQGAKAMSVNLMGADLRGADLRWADFRNAKFMGAKLQGANLKGANLQNANLMGAKLMGAKLKEADLQGAQLQGADLSQSNTLDANFQHTLFCNTTMPDGQLENRDCPAIDTTLDTRLGTEAPRSDATPTQAADPNFESER